MREVSEDSDLRKFRPTGMERSLSDFFETGKKEQFWCSWCGGYFEIKKEVTHPAGMLILLTCGHKDLKDGARRMTRYHKEKMRK